MRNLVLVCLEIVLVSVQDRSTVCVKRTTTSEIILDAPDGTPRLRGSSGSSFQSISRYYRSLPKIDARFVSNIPLARKLFWMHQMQLLADVGHVESRLIRFETV
jgi:hypothetical protein